MTSGLRSSGTLRSRSATVWPNLEHSSPPCISFTWSSILRSSRPAMCLASCLSCWSLFLLDRGTGDSTWAVAGGCLQGTAGKSVVTDRGDSVGDVMAVPLSDELPDVCFQWKSGCLISLCLFTTSSQCYMLLMFNVTHKHTHNRWCSINNRKHIQLPRSLFPFRGASRTVPTRTKNLKKQAVFGRLGRHFVSRASFSTGHICPGGSSTSSCTHQPPDPCCGQSLAMNC